MKFDMEKRKDRILYRVLSPMLRILTYGRLALGKILSIPLRLLFPQKEYYIHWPMARQTYGVRANTYLGAKFKLQLSPLDHGIRRLSDTEAEQIKSVVLNEQTEH